MVKTWIDQNEIKDRLADFFSENRDRVSVFGNTVNQTFEAFVFAAVVGWYESRGWQVQFRHPSESGTAAEDCKRKGINTQAVAATRRLRLKFSTRGRPVNYSYVVCRKGSETVHVRHQLRVATRSHSAAMSPAANLCLDVAVLKRLDLSGYSTNDCVPNEQLVTFGEAKHMSAFAELVASFEGLVHELQPYRLRRVRVGHKHAANSEHPAPFLYVSGILYSSAEGILRTVEKRRFDIDVYCRTKALADAFTLPEMPAKVPHRRNTGKRPKVEVPTEELPF